MLLTDEVSSDTGLTDDEIIPDTSLQNETETFINEVSETEIVPKWYEDENLFNEFLNRFYESKIYSEIITYKDSVFNIYQSATYGELLIFFALMLLITLFIMKWIYEVLR